MKILIVANEFPYPPNHGAKVDIWNRIMALKNQGSEIFLLTWYGVRKGDIPSEAEISHVKKNVHTLELFPIDRSWRRILLLTKYPSLVAARILPSKIYSKLMSNLLSFQPEAILIDGIYGGEIGLKIGQKLNIPVGVRLHNIEHQYMLGQYALTKKLRPKISLLLSLLHLKQFEYSLISASTTYFDISIEDLNYWKSIGMKHGHWLPSVFLRPEYRNDFHETEINKIDIGFLGNLNTPNNVTGLKWFVHEVYPLIKKSYPEVTFLVMGSEPSADIKEMCDSDSSIFLIPNPEHPRKNLEQTKVLINPVKFSSGVNIKSIDMLFLEHQVVSTSAGIKGMPDNIREVFFVNDEPLEFAASIISIIKSGLVKNNDLVKEELRNMFGYDSVRLITNTLKKSMQKMS